MTKRESSGGIAALCLLGALICFAPGLARYHISGSADLADRLRGREFKLIAGPGACLLFLAAYLLLPSIYRRISKVGWRWRSTYTWPATLVTACAIGLFVCYFGNKQFGGYDFSILIDTGWRLVSGQRPYADFVCTTPPGFYLGLKYAFAIFGASWNAQLYATAILGGVSFCWIFWLLSGLMESRLAGFLLTVAIECAAVLTLDFWWYNNVTAITATICFLSSLAFLKRPFSIGMQLSWIVSSALLCLMKPNVAGLLAGGAVVLMFVATGHRVRFALLTIAGCLLALTLLGINGISPVGLFASYAAAAAGRGAISNFGFREYAIFDLVRIRVCVAALSLPFLLWVPRFWKTVRQRDVATAAYLLLFVLAPAVSILGMFTNGELKDVEWSIFLASAGVLVFTSTDRWRLRRFYVAFLCALIASDLYIGAERVRVAGIGPHLFFEWDADVSPGTPFFDDLRASARFHAVVEQISEVLKQNPQPVFFGPRLEFSYAVFGLGSPRHLPVWWHPGTSFRAADEPQLLAAWRGDRFATLIFLKNDYTYYSPAFLRLVEGSYAEDERYSELTVFHAKK